MPGDDGLTIEELARALGGGREKKTSNGWDTLCPAHPDTKPSLSLTVGDTQPVVFTCRVGCSQDAVRAELAARGLSLNGHKGAQPKPRKLRRTLRHEVRDIDGHLIATHIRKEFDDGSKFMPWERADKPNLGGMPLPSLPLFGSERLRNLTPDTGVVVCEGEKAAESLWRRGLHAVGTVCGAAVTPDDAVLEILRPFRVVLWADNDDPGRSHMAKIAARLDAMGKPPRMFVERRGAAWHDDAADYPGTTEELRLMLNASVPYDGKSKQSQPDEPEDDFCIPATSIQEEPARWVYELYIEQAALNELIGDPSGGKTHVAIDICARLTRGEGFPDRLENKRAPQCVMYLSGEDHIRRSLKPRLRVAGADMEYVRFIMSEFFTEDGDGVRVLTPLVFPEHIPKLEHYIVANKVVLVVIDPITGFFNERTNTHNDAQVRKVLGALRAMAERTDCAVLSVRHLNKMSTEGKALYRGGGSIGLTAGPRSSLLIDFNPLEHGVSNDDPQRQRVLASNKINDAPKPPSRAFRIVADRESITGTTPYGVAHVEWLPDPIPVTANDLLRPQHKQRNSDALEEAKAFLMDELVEADKPVKEVVAKAQTLGISIGTLWNARKELGVKSRKKRGSFAGPRFMHLPTNEDGEPVVDGDNE